MDARVADQKMLNDVEKTLEGCSISQLIAREPTAPLNMTFADGIVEAGGFRQCKETGLENWRVVVGTKRRKNVCARVYSVHLISRSFLLACPPFLLQPTTYCPTS